MKTTTATTNKGIAACDTRGWKVDKIMLEILRLSHSQGCWGRLYSELSDLKREDSRQWKRFAKDVEYEEFHDLLDMVLYFEDGRHTPAYYQKKKRDGYHVYTVKVERSLECEEDVLARSEEEASKNAIYASASNRDMTDIKTTIVRKTDIDTYRSAAAEEEKDSGVDPGRRGD